MVRNCHVFFSTPQNWRWNLNMLIFPPPKKTEASFICLSQVSTFQVVFLFNFRGEKIQGTTSANAKKTARQTRFFSKAFEAIPSHLKGENSSDLSGENSLARNGVTILIECLLAWEDYKKNWITSFTVNACIFMIYYIYIYIMIICIHTNVNIPHYSFRVYPCTIMQSWKVKVNKLTTNAKLQSELGTDILPSGIHIWMNLRIGCPSQTPEMI